MVDDQGDKLVDIPAEVVQQAFAENQPLMDLYSAIETKLVTMSATEYLSLPAFVPQCWPVWKDEITRK